MKTMIDISRQISPDATVYPGDQPLTLRALCQIDGDCPCRITELGWTTHFLTHVDPPAHFIAGGQTLDDIPITRFVSEAAVIQVDGPCVERRHLSHENLGSGMSVLFKTENSSRWNGTNPFDESHVYLSEEAAQEAALLGLNMVGIDYLSIDRFGDPRYPAHRTLLSNGVLVLEGLDLSSVLPGKYQLYAFPLKIRGGDGSPVRAVLVQI